MTTDEQYMQRCLDLAIKGLGNVAPNPMVGSVIVHNGEILGEGYHQKLGQAHAEVNAVKSVPEDKRHLLSQSTLYVNLEPCAHFGKTPPCSDMIIAHKIPKVVIGSFDPYPEVSGKGIAKLKAAGVEVVTGVFEKQSNFLNRRFLTFYTHKRPYIILKWAKSADDFLAPAEPKQLWLTNDESKRLVHQWRGEEQAIMVGTRTVEIDDPSLTVRMGCGANPARITIDRNLSLSRSKKIFRQDAPLFIYNEQKQEQGEWINYVKLDFDKDLPAQIMAHLASQKIQSLIIEGGPYTLKQFINANLWDEARIFTAEQKLGTGKKTALLSGKVITDEMIGKDKLQVLLNG